MLVNVDSISHLKLIDFGLSKDVQKSANVKSLCSGSPYYIAPEILGEQIGLECDLWSLGVCMYVCLAGKLPFTGESQD